MECKFQVPNLNAEIKIKMWAARSPVEFQATPSLITWNHCQHELMLRWGHLSAPQRSVCRESVSFAD